MRDDEALTREERDAVFGEAGKPARWPRYVALVAMIGVAAVVAWIFTTARQKNLLQDERPARARNVQEQRIRLEAALRASREKQSALISAVESAKDETDRARSVQELQLERTKENDVEEELRVLPCVPGERRCAGDAQVCGTTGRWELVARCTKSNPCREGQCVEHGCKCTPGDPYCSCF